MMPVAPANVIDECSKKLFNSIPELLNASDYRKLSRFVYDTIYPEWRIVDDFPDKITTCLVSNIGKVKSIDDKVLPSYYNSSGYETVWIRSKSDPKRSYPRLVHRLVAIAFIPNENNLPEIDHINSDKSLNWYQNLKWCTHAENIANAIQSGHQVVGMNHKMSKYTNDQIEKVCKMLENPDIPFKDIAKMTGVSIKTITHIRMDNGWPHISSKYNFIKGRRNSGPRFSEISLDIRDAIIRGESDVFGLIRANSKYSGYSDKSIKDRIYHIKRLYGNH